MFNCYSLCPSFYSTPKGFRCAQRRPSWSTGAFSIGNPTPWRLRHARGELRCRGRVGEEDESIMKAPEDQEAKCSFRHSWLNRRVIYPDLDCVRNNYKDFLSSALGFSFASPAFAWNISTVGILRRSEIGWKAVTAEVSARKRRGVRKWLKRRALGFLWAVLGRT